MIENVYPKIRELRYRNIAKQYLEEYLSFKIRSKEAFCKKYHISKFMLNRYLDIILQEDQV